MPTRSESMKGNTNAKKNGTKKITVLAQGKFKKPLSDAAKDDAMRFSGGKTKQSFIDDIKNMVKKNTGFKLSSRIIF